MGPCCGCAESARRVKRGATQKGSLRRVPCACQCVFACGLEHCSLRTECMCADARKWQCVCMYGHTYARLCLSRGGCMCVYVSVATSLDVCLIVLRIAGKRNARTRANAHSTRTCVYLCCALCVLGTAVKTSVRAHKPHTTPHTTMPSHKSMPSQCPHTNRYRHRHTHTHTHAQTAITITRARPQKSGGGP